LKLFFGPFYKKISLNLNFIKYVIPFIPLLSWRHATYSNANTFILIHIPRVELL